MLFTYHHGVVVSTVHSEDHSLCTHGWPDKQVTVVPYPASEIPQLTIRGDVIVAGGYWHLEDWTSLQEITSRSHKYIYNILVQNKQTIFLLSHAQQIMI